ncbi:MAG: ABC transporter permease [Erysipelotrichaceae bacterium]|nr:ABC transporter permease [Erysipelotrichaceae bacterium]MBR5048802.1 ABC transporter permease [Erysipelotrichaceae bacterium]
MTLSSLIARLPGGVAIGILYGIMALGIYITFRVLKVSDLTVDGSFATGGAVSIMLMLSGVNPYVSLICAFAVGLLCGTVTGLLHTKLNIPIILSSILVQIGLYSVNLRIMQGSALKSISVDKFPLLINVRYVNRTILIGALISLILIAVLYWYFGTEQGSSIRATGNNSAMAKSNGISTATTTLIGLALCNGLVAFAGALMSQYQGFADVNQGRGAIVTGLAAIIIGEVLCDIFFSRQSSFWLRLTFVILGGVIYYLIMVLILWMRVDSNDLKLFTAIIVAIFLAIPNFRKGAADSHA